MYFPQFYPTIEFIVTYDSGRRRLFESEETFLAAVRRLRTGHPVVLLHHNGCTAGFPGDAGGIQQAKDAARDIWMRERRPVLWAEMRPDAMKEHMARRPKGYCRADWAATIDDETLDVALTLTEQVAALPHPAMKAHMARRPAGYPRPDWARRAISEPAGGYDAYKKIVLES